MQKTNVNAQKIDRSLLETYSMVIAPFQVLNKLGCFCFFQGTFLLANISMEIVLDMLFSTLSNADIQFIEKKLTWRTYTTKKALPNTCRINLINQKKFAKTVLHENIKAFIVYISSLGLRMTIYLVRKSQIALLLAKKVTVPAKYLDFADVFPEKSANILLEQTGVNEHAIKLEEGKQPPYELIYSLVLIEFKTLKTYIETNQANGFIWASKLLAGTPILFIHKSNSTFYLCVNYQWLNNFTIKNWYPLSLIGKSLDQLSQAK